MKQSFVLTIWRPNSYQQRPENKTWRHVPGPNIAYNAITGHVIQADTFAWVDVKLPDTDYRVEYYLDPEGDFKATKNTSVYSSHIYPVVMHKLDQRPGMGMQTCFLPVEWDGLRFSRRVLPTGSGLPMVGCVYCGAAWGETHGPECMTRGVRPLPGAEGV